MGLVRGILFTFLCYFAVERIWTHKLNPLPDNKRCEYEKYILLSLIFMIETLW